MARRGNTINFPTIGCEVRDGPSFNSDLMARCSLVLVCPAALPRKVGLRLPVDNSVFHDEPHSADGGDVGSEVALDGDEVGEKAGLNAAKLVVLF